VVGGGLLALGTVGGSVARLAADRRGRRDSVAARVVDPEEAEEPRWDACRSRSWWTRYSSMSGLYLVSCESSIWRQRSNYRSVLCVQSILGAAARLLVAAAWAGEMPWLSEIELLVRSEGDVASGW
jgi:hypothetical protein